MRKFILTILSLTIALGASALLYFIGAALGSLLATKLPGFPTDIGKGLAAVPLGGIKSIYELLEAGGIVFGSHAFLLWGQLMASGYDFNILSEDRTLSQHIAFLPQIVIFVISAISGFWYGQRQKLAYYLTFIMRMLPQKLRQTIVEMARDEAKRASPALHAAPSRSA